jgi:hypothetical protein
MRIYGNTRARRSNHDGEGRFDAPGHRDRWHTDRAIARGDWWSGGTIKLAAEARENIANELRDNKGELDGRKITKHQMTLA